MFFGLHKFAIIKEIDNDYEVQTYFFRAIYNC